MGTVAPDEKRPAPPSFTKQLRKRTNRQRLASAAINNLTLPLALSSPHVYLVVIRAFQHIVSAFEEEFEKRRRVYPRLNTLYFRELLRAPAFQKDMEYFSVLAGGAPLPDPPLCAQQFVRDMRAALAREPVLVVAYSYALYMGLFVGGARTAPWVRRAFELEGVVGTMCWDFSGTIDDRKKFRAEYDKALDAFAMDEAQRELIFDQVQHIFQSSSNIFTEIKKSAEYTKTVMWGMARAFMGVGTLAAVAWMWGAPFRWAATELVRGAIM